MVTPKKTKAEYFSPKYSMKMTEFIVDKIEGGMTLAEVCKKYAEHVPTEKNCYRWKKKYPEFKKAIDEAYQTLIFKFMDEMNDLSKKTLDKAKEIRDAQSINEKKDLIITLKAEMDAFKLRHKSLEFMLTKLAPKLVPELKDSSKDVHMNLPPITIVNYANDNTEFGTKGTWGQGDINVKPQ